MDITNAAAVNGVVAEQTFRREEVVRPVEQEQEQGSNSGSVSDIASLSVEGVELSRNVQPVGVAEGQDETTQQPPSPENSSTESENIPRFLDVRA